MMEHQDKSVVPAQSPVSLETIRLYTATNCTHCANPLMINGYQEDTYCHQCKGITTIDQQQWITVFKDIADELKKGRIQQETSFYSMAPSSSKVKFSFAREGITCRNCQAQFPFSLKDETANASLACPSCQTEIPIRKPSQALQHEVRGLQWLANEELSETTSTNVSSQNLVQKCPSCGGSLAVDGKSRVVDCSFCASTVTLSEEIWQRLHPVKIKKPWYLIFTNTKSNFKTDREKAYDKAMAKRSKKKERTVQPQPTPQPVRVSTKVTTAGAFNVWFLRQGGWLYSIIYLVYVGRFVYLLMESGLSFGMFLKTEAPEGDWPRWILLLGALLAPGLLFINFKVTLEKLRRGWTPEDDKESDD